MEGRALRRILIVWGIVCLLSPIAAFMHYPIMKVSTPQAVRNIEQIISKSSEISSETSNQLKFALNWILGNDKGLKRHSSWSYKLLSVISILSALISFYVAYSLRNLTRQ